MNTWEIKFTDDWDEAEKLAAEGWELVAVSVEYGIERYFFKRIKPQS